MSKLCGVWFPVPEKSCGDPPTPPHAGRVWTGTSTPGTTVSYYCKEGFYSSGGHHGSVCTAEGLWTDVSITCRGTTVPAHLSVFPRPPVCLSLPTRLSFPTHLSVCLSPPTCLSFHAHLSDLLVFPAHLSVFPCPPVRPPVFPRPPVYLSPPTCLCVPHLCACPRPPEDFLLLPAAAGCGVPPPLPHAVPLWDGDSTVGSRVVYRCARGYRSAANASVCTAGGKWDVASVLCEGVVPQFGLRVAAEFHQSAV